jgi:hypothetical protein
VRANVPYSGGALKGATMDEPNITQILSETPTHGADDYVTKVLEIYEGVMKVYGPANAQYTAAVDTMTGAPTISTSSNW